MVRASTLARNPLATTFPPVDVIWAICRRDAVAAFTTPLAWLVLACWTALVDGVFVLGLHQVHGTTGAESPLFVDSLRLGQWLLTLLVPAITMMSFAGERAQGTLQLLMTVPVREWQIVVGKFLAALCVVGALIAATLVQPLTLALISAVQWPHLLAGYAGLLLTGSFYAALGIWVSLVVDSPVAAYVVAFGAIAVLHLVGWAGMGNSFAPVADAIGLPARTAPFLAGELRLGAVAYLVCGAVLWLTLAVAALRAKR
jgi:ABC-2 type transport system permease protein